jgi:hypothetical protein
MFSNKFSKDNFELTLKKKGDDGKKELVSLLETAIQKRLYDVIKPEVEIIVRELNKLGHQLELYYDPTPGDISYIDKSNETPKLRIGVDSVVSVGYADLIDNND